MRYGKDDEDTKEEMQLKRHIRKYMPGQDTRHLGEQRLRHRGDTQHPAHKPKNK
jgi:hypothetical protein